MLPKDDQKAALIGEKAIEMIVEEGFDGFSMQKLADRAGISPSTIYIYFDSKEDMLTKLFIETARDFEEDALQNFEPSMNFKEGLWLQWKNRFRNIIKNLVRFYFFS
ncbi:MAG: helix-turn-helix domain-containing protein [Balneolaceae bacterium]|jgi:AcrR family transcriptional regulator